MEDLSKEMNWPQFNHEVANCPSDIFAGVVNLSSISGNNCPSSIRCQRRLDPVRRFQRAVDRAFIGNLKQPVALFVAQIT